MNDAEWKNLKANSEKVFAHYGLKAQLGQLSEECNELAIAAHHYQRTLGKTKDDGVEVASELDRKDARKELVSEIADVLNVVYQIADDLQITEAIATTRSEKMEREVNRIQEEAGRDSISALVDAGLMMAHDYSNLVSRLEGFVRTTKFVHPYSAEALLEDAIKKLRYRISMWRKALDGNKEC